jgi:hypothetical protein
MQNVLYYFSERINNDNLILISGDDADSLNQIKKILKNGGG